MLKQKCIAAAAALILMACSQAHAAGMDVKQLQGMLTGLGLTSKIGSDGVVVSDQGKYKSDILFSFNDEKTVIAITTSFEAIPTAKQSIIPFSALMKANASADWARFTFGICEASNAQWLCLGSNFDAATLNKKLLRNIIDDLLSTVDASEPLWNQEKWTAKVAGATVVDAKAAFEAAWTASPMQGQNAMFVSEKAANYGAFTKRATSSFKPGESLLIYVEPKNYIWKDADDGNYTFGVSIDAAILNEKGEVIYEKLDSMGHLSFLSRERLTELMLNLSFDLTGAPAGGYTLRYTLHDLNGSKSCIVALPFKIEG